MKTVRMLTDQVGGNGEPLAAGAVVELEDASASHWLKRGKAELVPAEEPEELPKPSDGLTVPELKAALQDRGIEIPDGAKKADLQALLDAP